MLSRPGTRLDDLLDMGHLHGGVPVDPVGHRGVVSRRGGLHVEVLNPPHFYAAADLPVFPPDVHVLERPGLDAPGVHRVVRRVEAALGHPAPGPVLLVRVSRQAKPHTAVRTVQDLHRPVLAEQPRPGGHVVGHGPDPVERGVDHDRVLGVPAHHAPSASSLLTTMTVSRGVASCPTSSSDRYTGKSCPIRAAISSTASESWPKSENVAWAASSSTWDG